MLTSSKINSRRLAHSQSGQAAVVGVFALILLAISLYTSYNISRTVAEKIQLQNIADSAAYSMATTEARTFNFIAFSNRCQIAHYAAAMSLQSVVSWVTYTEALLGYITELLVVTASALKDGGIAVKVIGVALCATIFLAAIGAALIEAGDAIKAIAEVVGKVATGINVVYKIFSGLRVAIDVGFAVLTWLLLALNYAYYAAGLAMQGATTSILIDCGWQYVQKNDPSLQANGFLKTLGSAYNVWKFEKAFDFSTMKLIKENISALKKSGGQASSSDEDVKAAQTLMTEMINASRFDVMVIDRQPGKVIEGVLTKAKDAFTKATDKVNDAGEEKQKRGSDKIISNLKDALNSVSSVLSVLSVKMGHTKLVNDVHGKNNHDDGLEIVQEDNSNTKFSQGTAMVSLDAGRVPIFGTVLSGWVYGIHAGTKNAYHCRYSRDKVKLNFDNPTAASNVIYLLDVLLANVNSSRIDCDSCKAAAAHPWLGIQPYVKFNPKSDDANFNQPDVIIWLNRPPEDMKLEDSSNGQVKDMTFSASDPMFGADFDPTIGKQGVMGSSLLPGINAIARAQCYYHRPGNWREYPNFFNPFWRARLARVSDIWGPLTEKVNIQVFKDFASSGIIAH